VSELRLHGRIMPASNATFLGELDGVKVVYKPIAGERPLWDFPDGTLAGREVAAHLVSEASGWNVVPPTWMGEGPHGPGMLQEWREPDEVGAAVDLVRGGAVPDGYLAVFDGVDEHDRDVTLVHEDSPALRRMAVLDVVLNNADRKGGHILERADGHRFGVDHGLTFHQEPKLRTVLWGWAGEPLEDEHVAGLGAILAALESDLADRLTELITEAEVEALHARTRRLLRDAVLPHPHGHWPAIPWPPF